MPASVRSQIELQARLDIYVVLVMAKLSKLLAVGLTGVAGAGILYSAPSWSIQPSDSKNETVAAVQVARTARTVTHVSASKKTEKKPSRESRDLLFPIKEWDRNWDRREPSHLVEPSKGGEDDVRFQQDMKEKRPKVSRHIILVRHGEYEWNGASDKQRILTKRGVEQAKLTGQRLATLNLPFQQLIRSTMCRAQETADHILPYLKIDSVAVEDDNMIEEGAPYPPEPPHPSYDPLVFEYFQDGSRIEAAFRAYIHRADYRQSKDSYNLLVCHGNVIRYFVCRALQLPPEAWLRIQLNNASITWICVGPTGRVKLQALGDSGHLPPELIT